TTGGQGDAATEHGGQQQQVAGPHGGSPSMSTGPGVPAMEHMAASARDRLSAPLSEQGQNSSQVAVAEHCVQRTAVVGKTLEPGACAAAATQAFPFGLRVFAGETDRRRTLDLADRSRVADEQLDLAFEHEAALDHDARPDHHARRSAGAEVEPAVGLLDQDAAVDARIGADVHVAVDRAQSLAQVRGAQPDVAVDVVDVAADFAAFIEVHRSVDRADFPGDAGAGADRDAAIDRAGRIDRAVIADVDRAIDRRNVLRMAAITDADGTVDRVEIAGGAA